MGPFLFAAAMAVFHENMIRKKEKARQNEFFKDPKLIALLRL
jgi:hypothetical protein